MASKIFSDENQQAAEMNKPEVVLGIAFVAYDDAAVVLEPSLQPFNLPAPTVTAQRSAILGGRLDAILPMRCNQLDAPFG